MEQNLELAQATTIAALMARPDEAASIFTAIRIEDLDGQYRLIAESIHGLRIARKPFDTLAVIDEATRRGTIGRIGGAAEVHRIGQFSFGSADYSLQIIARTARLRRLEVIGVRTQQLANQSDADPFMVAQAVAGQVQAIVDGIESEGEITTQTVGEFLTGSDAPFDWVIPGLLERSDRLILTGSEGLGKSVLFRQLAVCAAAGLHPFTNEDVPQQRVLYVDCENGVSQLRYALRPLVGQAKKFGQDPSEHLFIEPRPEGLDLTRAEDEMWLVKRVSALQPALLLTGPLYRLHAKNPNDEEPARQVARVLDRCRAAANCALVVEAHAGHAFGGQGQGASQRPVRPTGTSLWLRWPEFGYGLRAVEDYDPQNRRVEFVPWRGDRSQRDWPKRLKAGGDWPWAQDFEEVSEWDQKTSYQQRNAS